MTSERAMRATPQRRLLLDLMQSIDGHIDACELFRRARDLDASISLATVYRNLKRFRELGLVAERHLGEHHHHYEVRRGAEHHHLVCLGCGKVVEFASPAVESLVRQVSHSTGFRVVSIQIEFEGYCADCQQGDRAE